MNLEHLRNSLRARREVREEPRISLNKLGEYLAAKPSRRRTIVLDQKRPSNFKATWYRESRALIAGHLRGEKNESVLISEASRILSGADSLSDFGKQQAIVDAEAIEAYLSIAGDLELACEAIPQNCSPILEIAGVEVSVRPDALLKTSKGTGALKLYFGKTYPLDDESGQYASCILQKWVDATFGSAYHRNCIVLDVMSGEWFEAPRAYKRRLQDVEVACEEIAMRWELA